MDVLGDLVARHRRSEDPALLAPGEARTYDYHRFCTTAWKTGNFWRRRGVHASDEVASVGSSRAKRSEGVREDATVAVADDPAPEAIFALLGAALLGARTRFGLLGASNAASSLDSPEGEAPELDARVVVAPSEEIGDYDVSPGTQRVGYGGPPDDPAIAHFERDVWSENPAFPETPIDPGTVALVAGGDVAEEERRFSHADLLSSAREVVDEWGLEPGDEVAIRAPLAEPGTVVAGVVAPLLAGAAILLPDEEAVGDFAVVAGTEESATGADAPESETVAASAVV